jgi:hypothetical protein
LKFDLIRAKMMSKKDHFAQIIAAFALPIVLVSVAGWFAWNDTWDRAEGELSRTADGAAELADCLTSAPMGQFRHIAERRVSGSS